MSLLGAPKGRFAKPTPNLLRIAASEWLKLWTVRSPLILFTITGAIFPLLAWVLVTSNGSGSSGATVDGVPVPIDTSDPFQFAALQSGAIGWASATLVGQLMIGALGCLVIGGEYSTGMIRSTFAATPHRGVALAAKTITFALTTLAVIAVAIALGVLVTMFITDWTGYPVDWNDPDLVLALLGSAGYLTFVAAFSVLVGAIIRVPAGSITAVLGLLLVVPVVLQLVAQLTGWTWLSDATQFLPNIAGSRVGSYPFPAPDVDPGAGAVVESFALDNWQAALVLVAWIVVAAVAAWAVTRRRDV